MMAGKPALQFYPGDWKRDDVSGCSPLARCVWIESMFLMHDSKEYGVLVADGKPMPEDMAARRCGVTVNEYRSAMAELKTAGVPGIREKDGAVYSRRMVRDEAERAAAAERMRNMRRTSAQHAANIGATKPELEGEGEGEERPSFLPTSTQYINLPVSSDLPAEKLRAGFEEGRKAGPLTVESWCHAHRINGRMRAHLLGVGGVDVADLERERGDAVGSTKNPAAAAVWRVCESLGYPLPKSIQGRISGDVLKLQQIVYARNNRGGDRRQS